MQHFAPDTNILIGLINYYDVHHLDSDKFFRKAEANLPIIILPTPFTETKVVLLKKFTVVLSKFVEEIAKIPETCTGLDFSAKLLAIATKIEKEYADKKMPIDAFIDLIWSRLQTADNRDSLKHEITETQNIIQIYAGGIGEKIRKYNVLFVPKFPGDDFFALRNNMFLEIKKYFKGRQDNFFIAEGLTFCNITKAAITLVTTDNTMKDCSDKIEWSDFLKSKSIDLRVSKLNDMLNSASST